MDKQLSVNTTLSHYRIVSKIGAGGMGEVYLARDTQLDRIVALKILSAEVARDQQRLSRFLQEARAASKLKSANVARSEEHTSELQSQSNLVCRLLLEKKKKINTSFIR